MLDLSTSYGFKKEADAPDIKLSGLAASLNSLKLRKRGEDKAFLTIAEIRVKDTDIDLTGKDIAVGELATSKGVLNLIRVKDGTLNVQTLLPPSHMDE